MIECTFDVHSKSRDLFPGVCCGLLKEVRRERGEFYESRTMGQSDYDLGRTMQVAVG